MKNVYIYGLILFSLLATGCGGGFKPLEYSANPEIPDVPPSIDTDVVVRGMAIVEIKSDPLAYHTEATGSVNVTYVNAASVNFTINTAAFTAGAITGDTLSLGHVDLATLSDNNLKVCGAGGNQKCLKAIIRVYTTGSTTGFVQTTDLYGAPVFAGTLNPAVPIGLNSAGNVQVQLFNIAANKNKVKLSDFPSPNYVVTSDFSNAGSGSYAMTFVVEYALSL